VARARLLLAKKWLISVCIIVLVTVIIFQNHISSLSEDRLNEIDEKKIQGINVMRLKGNTLAWPGNGYVIFHKPNEK